MVKYTNDRKSSRRVKDANTQFFDYAMADQGGRKTRAFLEEMKAYIPYERLEKQ